MADPIIIGTPEVVDLGTSSLIPGPRGPKGDDGLITSITAGDGITVDSTDPAAPVVAAVPELTVDTSVGTRVSAGGVMIYGDTGWLDVSSLLAPGLALSANVGRCRIRRANSTVYVDLKVDVTADDLTTIFAASLGTGWTPPDRYPMSNQIVTATRTAAPASQMAGGTHVGVYYVTDSPLQTGSATPWPNPGTVAWTDSYATTDPWPTELPGAPA